jgi:hypothetical protein
VSCSRQVNLESAPFLRICSGVRGRTTWSRAGFYVLGCLAAATWCPVPQTTVRTIPSSGTWHLTRSYVWPALYVSHVFIGPKLQYGGHANFFVFSVTVGHCSWMCNLAWFEVLMAFVLIEFFWGTPRVLLGLLWRWSQEASPKPDNQQSTRHSVGTVLTW